MHSRYFLVCLVMFYCAAFSDDAETHSTPAAQEKSEFLTMKSGKFTFSYKVEEQNFVAKVSYPGAGWVAVGFNPIKMMKGANLIIGAVVDGKVIVSDEFGNSEFSHAPDTSQGGTYNIINGDVSIEQGLITMSFTIPLNSGDNKDAALEKGKTIKMIFAAGKKANLKSKHNALGKATITL